MVLVYDSQTGAVTSYAGVFFQPGVDPPPTRDIIDGIQFLGDLPEGNGVLRVYNPQVMHSLWQYLGVSTPLRVVLDEAGRPASIMATVVENDVSTEIQIATYEEAVS